MSKSLFGNRESFQKANYCSEDQDCKAIQLGGPYVEFGCWKYVNKNYNTDEIFRKLEDYIKNCPNEINECMPAPEAVCRENKCVSIEEIKLDTSNWRTYRNEEWQIEFKYPGNFELVFQDRDSIEFSDKYREKHPEQCKQNPICDNIQFTIKRIR
jgi:hypothetical protein